MLTPFGGDGGIRTLDLTDANRTLSQLSYAPKALNHYNTFFEFVKHKILICAKPFEYRLHLRCKVKNVLAYFPGMQYNITTWPLTRLH